MSVLCGPAFVVSGILDVREESGPPALASGDQKAMSPAGESFQYCGVDSLAFEKLEGESRVAKTWAASTVAKVWAAPRPWFA